MFHPETLFLIDDDQSQVFEFDLGIEQFMGADDQVHGPVPQSFDGLLVLRRRLEAGHHLDRDRKTLVPVGESLEMLLGQKSGRHQNGHLFGVLDGLEGSPDGDLGLAEAHVPANEPVHGDGFLHVRLDLVDGGQLIGGLLVGEGLFQLALPGSVGAEGEALGPLPGGVKLDQVLGDLLDLFPGLGLGLGPVGAAQLVEFGFFRAYVFAHLIQLIGGDVKAVRRSPPFGRGVFDDQILAEGLVGRVMAGSAPRGGGQTPGPGIDGTDGTTDHLHETADAMLLMDDEVALLQLDQVDGLAPAFGGFGLGGHGRMAGDVPFRQEGQMGLVVDESVGSEGQAKIDPGHAGRGDDSPQAGQGPPCGGGHGDGEAALAQCLDA